MARGKGDVVRGRMTHVAVGLRLVERLQQLVDGCVRQPD